MHAFTGVVVSFAVMAAARGAIPLKLADVFGDHMVSQCDAKRWQFSPGHRHHLRHDGDTVTSASVPTPTKVRYAWQPFTTANLVKSAGLPASTFLLNIAP